MRNFKTINEEERNQILEDKKNNPFISSTELAKKYNISTTALNTFLNKNNCTTKELTGLRFRKYNVNDNYFNKIDSHEKAYLLGVWYSDGYLAKEGKTKRIGLDVKDANWLESIGNVLESESPLYKTAKNDIKRLKITSPKMYDDLIKLGCIEHKTFLLEFPSQEIVPNIFLNSFILGILDGDGSIIIATPRNNSRAPEVSISFTGTKELLQGIQEFLKKENLVLQQRFPERKNNNYTLTISGIQQVSKILKILYHNHPKCVLQRKYQKYLKIINDSRVSS